MLSKYHGVLIPLGTAYIALRPPMRRWLLRPGPYLALAVGLVTFSPVLFWNASHGWASFLFQGGPPCGSWTLRPDYLFGSTFWLRPGYLFPWVWGSLIVILIV